jgi:hypothetical protein
METNFKNMPQPYYDNLKKMGKSGEIKYGEFKEQGLPNQGGNNNTSTTTGLPAWTKDYPCLSDYGKLENTDDKTDNKQVYTKGGSGANFHYNKDFSFVYVKGSDKIKGTWKCVNGKLLIKTPSNNKEWTKEKDWYDVPKQARKSDYTKCDEKLPIKQWCKNETIKKVQACLKMPPRFLTGNFGQNTQEYLESRGQNGKVITIDTIKNVCGANHPLVTSLAGAGGSTTGGSDSGGSGTTGGSTTGGGTPSQTKISAEYYNDYEVDEVETSAQTTYDGYYEEEPTQPKSTSSNLNTSNRKSSYNRQNLADYGNFLNNQ